MKHIKQFISFLNENNAVILSMLNSKKNQRISHINDLKKFHNDYGVLINDGEIKVYIFKLLLDKKNFIYFEKQFSYLRDQIENYQTNKRLRKLVNLFMYKSIETFLDDLWNAEGLLETEESMLDMFTGNIRRSYRALPFKEKIKVLEQMDTILRHGFDYVFKQKISLYADDFKSFKIWLKQFASDPTLDKKALKGIAKDNILYQSDEHVLILFDYEIDYYDYLQLSTGSLWCTHSRESFDSYQNEQFLILFNLNEDVRDRNYKIFLQVSNHDAGIEFNNALQISNMYDEHVLSKERLYDELIESDELIAVLDAYIIETYK